MSDYETALTACLSEAGFDGDTVNEAIRLYKNGSRDDLNYLYQGMDIFFLPSKGEGFGLACIEAEASGLPCVVSSNFPSEVNITGDVTFLPLEDSVDSWASAIIDAIGRNTDREGANRILRDSSYSKAGSGNTLTDYYEKVLSQGEKN